LNSKIGDSGVSAIQHNLQTNYLRLVFRDSTSVNEEILYEEEEKAEVIKLVYFVAANESKSRIFFNELDSLIKSGQVKENIPYFELSRDTLEQLESEFDTCIKKEADSLSFSAFKGNAAQLKSKLLQIRIEELEMANENYKLTYPTNWISMEESNFKMVGLEKTNDDYKRILKTFKETMPNSTIVKIEQIQNKWLWTLYAKSVDLLKGRTNDANEMWLFHGTRNLK